MYILFIEPLDKRIFIPCSVEIAMIMFVRDVLPNVTGGLISCAFERTEWEEELLPFAKGTMLLIWEQWW